MHTQNRPIRIFLGLLCAAVVGGGAFWFMDMRKPTDKATEPRKRSSEPGTRTPSREIFIDENIIADGGLTVANKFTQSIGDPKSLVDLRNALESRGQRGLTALRGKLEELQQSKNKQLGAAELELHYGIGSLLLFEGRFEEAAASFDRVLALGRSSGLAPEQRQTVMAVRGITALRRGEVENCIECLGPSSCIFPIAREAVHQNQSGSREAIEHFLAYLNEFPGDIRIRWLLNIAYMTLGEYPEKVPAEYLIQVDFFDSKLDVPRFTNVAQTAGLTSRGPNLAGGSVFDDFTGDGLPDLFTTSLDADRGASLYVNRGDGTFEDRSDSAGIADQIYALNVSRADFDNDGDLDVVLLRGGWERPMRLSLLRNNGNGTFEDATVDCGLGEPIATESAAWGDYDNDGLVDLFVCGEYLPPDASTPPRPDPRNRCRLYHNLGHGKFVDVAAEAGVLNEQCAKGSAWGDYDNDNRLDLYVSNMGGTSRLYHNEGGGKFRDVAPELRVTGPDGAFACWFWDYDNDGRLDLYVNDYTTSLADSVAFAMGLPTRRSSRPHLYRNVGDAGFREVSREVGLDRPLMPMGCNFADLDNDGFLDIYLGTGRMFWENLFPNSMFKSVAGERFEDVTLSSGTGHLQKGHGISFADFDGDGDLDLFVEAGGVVPGDRSYNVLFQNPGHDRHWLKVKLVGATTNRAALGAKIRAVVQDRDGGTRSIYRTVGDNSSFGGNCLVELIGLQEATRVTDLQLYWPVSETTQTFRDVAADQSIEITEGVDSYKPLAHASLPSPRK